MEFEIKIDKDIPGSCIHDSKMKEAHFSFSDFDIINSFLPVTTQNVKI